MAQGYYYDAPISGAQMTDYPSMRANTTRTGSFLSEGSRYEYQDYYRDRDDYYRDRDNYYRYRDSSRPVSLTGLRRRLLESRLTGLRDAAALSGGAAFFAS